MAVKKRKPVKNVAKRSAAAKKAARSRKAVKAMKIMESANKTWDKIYGAKAVAKTEPMSVYEWGVENGRRPEVKGM
jgi:hypothetical protein